MCVSVCLSICVSVSASVCLSGKWQNGRLDPDAIWDGDWGQSSNGWIIWGDDRLRRRGSFDGEFGAFHCNQ